LILTEGRPPLRLSPRRASLRSRLSSPGSSLSVSLSPGAGRRTNDRSSECWTAKATAGALGIPLREFVTQDYAGDSGLNLSQGARHYAAIGLELRAAATPIPVTICGSPRSAASMRCL